MASIFGLIMTGFMLWVCYAAGSKLYRMFTKTTKKNYYATTTPYTPRKIRR